MEFEVVFTAVFEKKYLKKSEIKKETIIKKAEEIQNNIFYSGEGRVKGSKILYKKRIALENTSKRRGGRILIALFHKTKNIYVPYALWFANESAKQRMDQKLKSRKEISHMIQETIIQLQQNS